MHLKQEEITRSPDERLTLIAALWESLDDEQIPVTAVHQAELERRLATLNEDATKGVTWEALRARLERRCP